MNKFSERKLISTNDKSISYLQIFGIFLVLSGIISLISAAFIESPAGISISFFITMLGFAFVFPSLLEGNDGLSTMRIVVFMMTNVICMLLLKIGWAPTTESLSDIGLDEWWMGVIAFVFGAKAMQSYFESKMAVPSEIHKTEDEIAKQAIVQYKESLAKEKESHFEEQLPDPDEEQDPFKKLPQEEQKRIINEYIQAEADNLKKQFPEVQGMAARTKKINGLEQNFKCLHFDIIEKVSGIEESKKLPAVVVFTDSKNTKYSIPTDVTGVGNNELSDFINAKYAGDNDYPKQLGLSCSRINSNAMGTIGLKVYKNQVPYLLSCYHVLCAPELNDKIVTYNGNSKYDSTIISPGKLDGINNKPIANVTNGILNNFIDAAIAKLKNDDVLENEYYHRNIIPKGTISLSTQHVNIKYKVNLVGRTSGKKTGELIDDNQGVAYFKGYPNGTLTDEKFYNIIVTTKISDKGDSGASVFDNDGKVIGLLFGDNKNCSYIFPINTIINRLDLDDYK